MPFGTDEHREISPTDAVIKSGVTVEVITIVLENWYKNLFLISSFVYTKIA